MTENNIGCNIFHPSEYYPTWTVEPPTDNLKQALKHCTGWQSIARPAEQTVCGEYGAHDQPVPIDPFQTQKQQGSYSNIPSNNNMVPLPYAQVDLTLRALAGQAEGFGHCAIGGLHGPLYHVTTLAG